jgi:hypothetical protein
MPRRDIRRFINFFGFLPNAEVIKFYHAPKLKPRARLHVCMRLAASSAGGAGLLLVAPAVGLVVKSLI